jgi:hypothetical protein
VAGLKLGKFATDPVKPEIADTLKFIIKSDITTFFSFTSIIKYAYLNLISLLRGDYILSHHKN